VVGFLAGNGAGNNNGPNNGQAPPNLGLSYYFGDPNAANSKFVSGAAAFARDLPVADLVGYAFAHKDLGGTNADFTGRTGLGNGPALAIGDSTASGLSLGFINIDNSGNGNNFQDFSRGAFGSNVGDAIVREQGTIAGILSWERWTEGNVNDQDSHNYVLAANQGIHIISGKAATNIPTTGTYIYNKVGGTSPTIADGSVGPGTLADSSKVGVAFNGASSKFGVDLKVNMGTAGSYNVLSPGGTSTPSISANTLATTGVFSATGIPTTLTSSGPNAVCGSAACTANVNGFLSGNAASNLGIAYQFGNASIPTKMVSGAAGFGRPMP
jgi:hypothetical protein